MMSLIWTARGVAALVAAAAFACVGSDAGRAAAMALAAPDEVVLYAHSSLSSSGFIDILACALERVLVAPVRVARIDLPLGAELRVGPTRFDAPKLIERFSAATGADGPRRFRYLFVADDLQNAPFAYVFAISGGDASSAAHAGVVSTGRLEPRDPAKRTRRSDELTAQRAYKLVLKSIARIAGYVEAEGCLLALPRSLEELDAKPAEFCAEDRAALVAAGILKATESGGCAPVS